MDGTRLVALLRGVNVGGKHKMAMRDLCEVFSAAGCAESRSYIQSGNIVFGSRREPAELQGVLAATIEARFGFAVPVVIRTAAELRSAIEANPFAEVAEDRVAVMFLRDRPDEDAVARLEKERFSQERFAVRAGEIYLDMPNGAGRSKMTSSYFDSRLRTVGTVRNLRTVRALLAMA